MPKYEPPYPRTKFVTEVVVGDLIVLYDERTGQPQTWRVLGIGDNRALGYLNFRLENAEGLPHSFCVMRHLDVAVVDTPIEE